MTGIIINAQFFGLALLLCDDFAAAMMPFLAVMCQGATLFENWEAIVPHIIPWGFLPAVGLVFHLIAYRKPLKNGLSVYGLVATGLAILLGGFGTVSALAPFESATNAFYYFGLSFGLLLLYFLFSSNYKRMKDYDVYEHFLWQMLFTGLIAALIIFRTFFTYTEGALNFSDFRHNITFRNSLANVMIMGLPAPFYFAAKKKLAHRGKIFSFFLGLFIYLGLCFTTSRTAILFGTLLLPLCLIYYFKYDDSKLAKTLNSLALAICLAAVLYIFPLLLDIFDHETLWEMLKSIMSPLLDVNAYEARFKLLFRAASDFLSHPLFGIGLLSQENSDTFSVPAGCICWYHMYFPQIFGSMGLVGAAAYTLHLGVRARLAFFCPDQKSVAITLTALSLFLYSMTDPGEFMPIPFGMMAVLAFVLLERHAEAHPDWRQKGKIFKKHKKL